MNECPECYKSGTDRFKQLLCSTEPVDPCDCGSGGGAGGEQADQDKTSSNLPLIVGGLTIGTLALGLVFLSGRK